MKVGKLPADLLERLLADIPVRDSRVLLGASMGEDAAVIDMGHKALIATTDPVTFATDLIGWYAVQVNANDVACMGARPRWFLATILLPEGSPSELAESILHQITSACGALDVTLVGGHSEVTSGIDRPIVVGHMLGEVERERVVRTSGAIPGDAIVLTRGIAIEGTAILAREASDALRLAGASDDTINTAADLLFNPGISVVDDALAACEAVQVHSMHDPTEGGLATGLREIALAARVGVEADADSILTFPACSAICDALELDPLGLLASGALVITLAEDQVPTLIDALDARHTSARVIGRITDPAWGVKLRTELDTIDLPVFERDELARYLSLTSS